MCRVETCVKFLKIEFKKIHQVGSYVRYIHSDGSKTVVPVYSNEMLGRGLINEILKQVKLSRDEYEKLRLEI